MRKQITYGTVAVLGIFLFMGRANANKISCRTGLLRAPLLGRGAHSVTPTGALKRGKS